jgi:hypothetical protein
VGKAFLVKNGKEKIGISGHVPRKESAFRTYATGSTTTQG